MTTSNDQTVRIWDVATEQAVTTLTGHIGSVLGVAIDSDGTWLATTGHDPIIWGVQARNGG